MNPFVNFKLKKTAKIQLIRIAILTGKVSWLRMASIAEGVQRD